MPCTASSTFSTSTCSLLSPGQYPFTPCSIALSRMYISRRENAHLQLGFLAASKSIVTVLYCHCCNTVIIPHPSHYIDWLPLALTPRPNGAHGEQKGALWRLLSPIRRIRKALFGNSIEEVPSHLFSCPRTRFSTLTHTLESGDIALRGVAWSRFTLHSPSSLTLSPPFNPSLVSVSVLIPFSISFLV
jgi:hypothetical protein